MASPAASSDNPAVHAVLPDGTVLYKTWQDAEAARLQQADRQPSGAAGHQAQAKLGQPYLTTDGTVQPYTLERLVEFQATGLLVVMVVLACLYLTCSVIGRLLRRLEQSLTPAERTDQPTVAAAELTGIHPGLSDQELVVLLTAAAVEVLDQPVRVERFRPLTAKDWSWVAQGRNELVQSHRLK